MTPDPQLLQDAHDAALNVVAILEKSDAPDRVTVDNAVRWASISNAKLVAYQVQQRDNQKGVPNVA
jgi:hypothetical protein